jgi:hypothetical protein
MDGIIYSHIKVGSYNGDEFLEYLTGLLTQMNPYPEPRSVLVIDNCRIHHVAGVEDLCAARYVLMIYWYFTYAIVIAASSWFTSLPTHQTTIRLRSVSPL